MNKEIPEWIKEEDDKIIVETKEGTFVLEDIPYEKVMKAKSRTTGGKTDPQSLEKFQLALISESIVSENKKGELDLMKLRASTIIRLQYGISLLYDLESFL